MESPLLCLVTGAFGEERSFPFGSLFITLPGIARALSKAGAASVVLCNSSEDEINLGYLRGLPLPLLAGTTCIQNKIQNCK